MRKAIFLLCCALLAASPVFGRAPLSVLRPMLGEGPAPQIPAPTDDGTAFGNAIAASPVVSNTLTLTKTNDWIIGLLEIDTGSSTGTTGTAFTCTPTSGSPITLTKHATYSAAQDASGNIATVEEWSAFSPGTFSGTCSATLSATSAVVSSMAVLGVNGANQTNPWDPNSSLPAKANNTAAGSTPSVGGVSTNAAELLIAVHAGYNSGSVNPGTGWTGITGGGYAGDAEYNRVTLPQSNITASFGAQGGAGGGYVIMADAIQAGSGSPPGTAYYVSTTGSDSNTGLSAAAAFATLGKALTAMQGGSIKTTYLEPGTYTLTSGSYTLVYLTLTSADTGETWSGGPANPWSSVVINASHDFGNVWLDNGGSNITWTNMTIENPVYHGIAIHGGAAFTVVPTFNTNTGLASGNTVSNIECDNITTVYDGGSGTYDFDNSGCVVAEGAVPNTTINHIAVNGASGAGVMCLAQNYTYGGNADNITNCTMENSVFLNTMQKS